MASIVDWWWARRLRRNPSEYAQGAEAALIEIVNDRWTSKDAQEYLDAIGDVPPRDAWERGFNDTVAALASARR